MIAYTFYHSDPRVRREAEALVSRGDSVDFICARDPKNTDLGPMGVNLLPLSVGRYQGTNTFRYLLIYISFLIRSAFRVTRLHLRKPLKRKGPHAALGRHGVRRRWIGAADDGTGYLAVVF